MKACTVCGSAKSLFEFSRDRSRKDGHAHRCKQCDKEKAAKWQRDNPERMSATKKAWRESNEDAYRAARHARHARQRIRDRAVIREKNRRRRGTMRRGMDEVDIALSIAYRIAIAKDHCFYCGGITDVMHSDHYVPVAMGGTDHWFNLVRACQPCNASKGARCGTWMQLTGRRTSITRGQLALIA